MQTSHVTATVLAVLAAIAAALLMVHPQATASDELYRSERKDVAGEIDGVPPVGTATPVTVSPKPKTAETNTGTPAPTGIDVSHFNIDKNGQKITIKWDQVAKSGITFAYINASQGRTLKDPEFDANWAGAKAVNIPKGAYHFLSALVNPAAQAKFFLSVYDTRGDSDLAPVVDVEWDFETETKNDRWEKKSATQIVAALDTWLTAVASATGKTPIIYTNKAWWDARVGAAGKILGARYPVWLADYTTQGATPAPLDGFKTVLWQFTDAGTVAGVDGNVDVSRKVPADEGLDAAAAEDTSPETLPTQDQTANADAPIAADSAE